MKLSAVLLLCCVFVHGDDLIVAAASDLARLRQSSNRLQRKNPFHLRSSGSLQQQIEMARLRCLSFRQRKIRRRSWRPGLDKRLRHRTHSAVVPNGSVTSLADLKKTTVIHLAIPIRNTRLME